MNPQLTHPLRHFGRALHLYQSSRCMSTKLNRPSPPPLPRDQQREFEEQVRKAQAPFTSSNSTDLPEEAQLALHPDARKPVRPEFQGEINPNTGEQGGPKQEPVKQWRVGEGDWSFKGRVSDF